MTTRSPSRTLITFVRDFTELQMRELEDVRETLRASAESVAAGIQKIGERTAENKRKASEVLVSTYTAPGAEAKAAMDSVQDEVDRMLAEAMGDVASGPTAATPVLVPRNAGFFSKHMEALETLDVELQEVLGAMMGRVAEDDQVAARLEQVTRAMRALGEKLTFVLADWETRSKKSGVDAVVRELREAFDEVLPKAS